MPEEFNEVENALEIVKTVKQLNSYQNKLHFAGISTFAIGEELLSECNRIIQLALTFEDNTDWMCVGEKAFKIRRLVLTKLIVLGERKEGMFVEE